MPRILCQMKSYIQPFERILALKELHILSGAEPKTYPEHDNKSNTYLVDSEVSLDFLLQRLTYWETLGLDMKTRRHTRQVCVEATSNKNGRSSNGHYQRQELFPHFDVAAVPNRRVLRYGPHGIHEYRGKFFPQLVRSLLNIAALDENSIVLDTLCGSGTTLVEASLLGCRAIGMDMNPLSVLISRVKCEIISADVDGLIASSKSVKKTLKRFKAPDRLLWFENLPITSQRYLRRWFSQSSLRELDNIILCINALEKEVFKNFFKICLSNILRRISYQKTDDLRVRLDKNSTNSERCALHEFLVELDRSLSLVIAFLRSDKDVKPGESKIIAGDAREADIVLAEVLGRVDVVVTSPPYATALPYLDTDRLSLYYLDLLPLSDHRKLDLRMIGNREITNGYRDKYLDHYRANKQILPLDITKTIDLIASLNSKIRVGFRRQNLPALLAQYFFSMRKVFESYLRLLEPNSFAFLVVGNNHTIAGGERVEIETAKLLAKLGESVNLKVEDGIPMEMLVSRDIFKKNSSSAETIIVFKKT